MLSTVTKFLPTILAGLIAGTVGEEVEGNGMFLGKRDHTYQIHHVGEGYRIKEVPHYKIPGFYAKHGGDIYRGEGILHGLFKQIPLLNILF